MEGLIEGRIVHYILTQQDADAINRRRTNSESIKERLQAGEWPAGAQAHIGNPVAKGEHCPMIVVRVWNAEGNGCFNGHVLLDGSDALWVKSVSFGEGPGTCHWPERAS